MAAERRAFWRRFIFLASAVLSERGELSRLFATMPRVLMVAGQVTGKEDGDSCSIGIEKTARTTRLRVDGQEVRSISALARRLPVMGVAHGRVQGASGGERTSPASSRLDAVSRGTGLSECPPALRARAAPKELRTSIVRTKWLRAGNRGLERAARDARGAPRPDAPTAHGVPSK